MELSTVAIFTGSLLLFNFIGFRMLEQMGEFMRHVFKDAAVMQIDQESIKSLLLWSLYRVGVLLLPIMAVTLMAGVATNIAQVGLFATSEPLMPKSERIDPVKGFKRIFSKQSMMDFLKSLLKLVIIGFITFSTIKGESDQLFFLYDMEIINIVYFLVRISLKILLRATLGLLAIAAMDYAFQRWQHEHRLKMTKKELKDELKQREGDPLIKSRIKSIQLKMARQRMMAAVPEADVVITNPTHLAIALQYRHGLMEAPKVVAKGAGYIALKIIDLAKEHDVPVMEDKLLARSLYSAVDVGRFVPVQLYRAVAEILAYVYQLKNRV